MFRTARRFHTVPFARSRPQTYLPGRASFSRTAFRLEEEARSQPQALNPYKVRFQNPGLTTRRLATFCLYSTCFTAYIWYFAPAVEVEVEVQDVSQNGALSANQSDDGFEESEYAEEDSFFIPLTWAWKLPRTYYKGSDPEWKEFVKVAKDQPRHKRINRELTDIIYQGSLAHPMIAKQLGREPKIGKYWLDISFPEGPPQEYARSGIEVGDDFIALSTQRLSPEQQHRVSRAIWPVAAANSLYASSKVVFAFQYRRLKAALGLESTPEPGSPEARMQHMLQMMQTQQQKQEQGKLVPGKTPDAGTGTGSGSGSGSAASTSSPDSGSKSLFPWLTKPPMPSTSAEMPLAFHVFNHTLAKGWLPKNNEPPRGTFVVQGLIQVKGARAVITFDVNAHYSPKESRFVVVNATPRSLKKWHQSPRGGL